MSVRMTPAAKAFIEPTGLTNPCHASLEQLKARCEWNIELEFGQVHLLRVPGVEMVPFMNLYYNSATGEWELREFYAEIGRPGRIPVQIAA